MRIDIVAGIAEPGARRQGDDPGADVCGDARTGTAGATGVEDTQEIATADAARPRIVGMHHKRLGPCAFEAIDARFVRRFPGTKKIWIGIACAPVLALLAFAMASQYGLDEFNTYVIAGFASLAGLAIIPLLAALAKLVLWLTVLGVLLAAMAALARVLFTFL